MWFGAGDFETGRVFPDSFAGLFKRIGLLEKDEMKTRKMHSPQNRQLLAKLELLGQRLVTAGVHGMEIIQQTPPLADHFQQSAARTVVLDVFLQMFRQVVDALRQQGDLNIG